MKKSYYLFFVFTLNVLVVKAQQFEFPIFFENAQGEKDTIIMGYDPEATTGIDTAFGEVNIKGTPFSGFDVRNTDVNYSYLWCSINENVDYSTFHSKKQITNDNCEIPWGPFNAIIFEHIHFPVTVSWDRSAFAEYCTSGPMISDWHPGGWYDAPCENSQGIINMSEEDYFVFDTAAVALHTIEGDTVNYLFFGFFNPDVAVDDLNTSKYAPVSIKNNPVYDNYFQLESKELVANADIYIYTVIGQLVSQQKWTSMDQKFELSSGHVFFVNIVADGQVVSANKLVRLK